MTRTIRTLLAALLTLAVHTLATSAPRAAAGGSLYDSCATAGTVTLSDTPPVPPFFRDNGNNANLFETNDEGFDLPTGNGTGLHDVFWKFTPTFTSEFRLEAVTWEANHNSEWDSGIGVLTGECGNFTIVASRDVTNAGEILNVMLEAGTEYTIIVEQFQAGEEGFIDLRVGIPPYNDLPANAFPIDPGFLPYVDFGNTTCANDEGIDSMASINDGYGHGQDVWYTFHPATTATYRFLLDNEFFPALGVFDSTFVELSSVTGSEADPLKKLDVFLDSTQTYYVQVEGPSTFEAGAYTLRVGVPVPNDDCSGRPAINPMSLTYRDMQDTTMALDSEVDNSASVSAGGGQGADLFYGFNPTSTSTYRIIANGFNTGIGVFASGCMGTEVAAADATTDPREHLDLAMDAGTDYVIVAEGRSPADTGYLDFRFGLPPANDLCADATVIDPNGLPYSIAVDGSMALDEGLDTSKTPGAQGGDLFWRFTPDSTGTYKIEAATMTTNAAIAIYEGDCGSLTEIVARNQSGGGESLTLPLSSGTTYTIMVEGASQSDGPSYQFTVSQSAPENDLCDNATALSGFALPHIVHSALFSAGNEGIDSSAAVGAGGGGGLDVFYRFTPPETGTYFIEVTSDFDSAIAMYGGACMSLFEFFALDATVLGEAGEVDLAGGQPYTLLVEGHSAADFGSFDLTISPVPPENYLCSTAKVISPGSLPYFDTVSNGLAGDEGIDNSASVAIGMDAGHGKDVFWTFTPDVSTYYHIEADGIDSGIGVFTGACDDLTEVAAVDMFSGTMIESLDFPAVAGQAYTILVEGRHAYDNGNISLVFYGVQPGNDYCDTPTVIGAMPFADEAINNFALSEAVDNPASINAGGGGGRDLWWNLASFSDTQPIRVIANGFNTSIGIYDGTCNALNHLASVDATDGGEVLETVLPNTGPFSILVEGRGPTDVGEIDFRAGGVPPNDTCATPTMIDTTFPFFEVLDNLTMALDEGTDSAAGLGGGSDLFYVVTPPQAGRYRFRTDTTFNGGVAVYSGDCGSLTVLAEPAFSPTGNYVDLQLEAGVTYTAMVEGSTPADWGAFKFLWGQTPMNDACADATAITELPSLFLADTGLPYDEGLDSSFATELDFGGGNDAFWSFTPDATAVYSAFTYCTAPVFLTIRTDCTEEAEFYTDVILDNMLVNLPVALDAGTTYLFEIDGVPTGQDAIFLFGLDHQPVNDVCSSATIIDPAQLPFSVTQAAFAAHDEGIGHDIVNGSMAPDWYYRFTPTHTGMYRLATTSGGNTPAFFMPDTGFILFTGTCNLPTSSVTVNDHVGDESMDIMLDAGTTYRVIVEGLDFASIGPVTFSLSDPNATPTPSPTPSPTATASPTPSPTPTSTPTASPSPTPTISPTATMPPTATPTTGPSPSPSMPPTASPSATASPTAGPSPSPSMPPTATQPPTPTPTVGPSPSPSMPPTASPVPSASPTAGPTASPSPSPTAGPSPSPSMPPTATPVPSASPTTGPTPSPSASPSPSMPPTPSPTASPSPTPSASPSPSPTPSDFDDSDGDGFSNGIEMMLGSEPGDPNSVPGYGNYNGAGGTDIEDAFDLFRDGTPTQDLLHFDVNGDGMVDQCDARVLYLWCLGEPPYTTIPVRPETPDCP